MAGRQASHWPKVWRCRWIYARTGRQRIPIRFGRRRRRLSASGRTRSSGRPRDRTKSRCWRSCMACSHRRGCGRLRGSRSLRWRRRNRRTRRRLGNDWAGRRRNLCGLRRRNDHRLWNNWRRRRRRGLCFDGAHRRRGRAARLGNNRSGGRRNRGRRRRRNYHSGLHASRSGGCFFRCLIRNCLLFGLCFRFGDGRENARAPLLRLRHQSSWNAFFSR